MAGHERELKNNSSVRFFFRMKRRRVKNGTCNCKKSKCLKLYCDCFAASIVCGDECKCVDCKNRESEPLAISMARNAILRRNTDAFVPKIAHGTMHTRGCKCKHSQCKKGYCECFQSGVQCTQYCECTDCCNGKDGVFKAQEEDTEGLFTDFRDMLQTANT